MAMISAEDVIYRESTDSTPVIFVQGIQRRERWLPRKGAQGEMGTSALPPRALPSAS